jgi:hypothetical protein
MNAQECAYRIGSVMTKDKTAKERNKRHRAAKLSAGIVRLEVQVPADKREEILEIAKRMREEFESANKTR